MKAALAVAGVAVGVVGGVAEDGDRAVGLVEAHHAVVGDVGEDEIAAGGEVGRSFRPPRAGPQLLQPDCFARAHNAPFAIGGDLNPTSFEAEL